MPLRLILIVVFTAVLGCSGWAQPVAATISAASCFPQTGKCIHELFEGYWLANGGVAQQGYPITDAFIEVSSIDGQRYLVQYFERARFEYHPENAGTEYVVLLGQLGREQYLARYPQGQPPGGTGDVCFLATGRCMRGSFYQYWQANGGLAQQGYPITDEFDEVNPTDGKTYRTQYFERARFEHHPENTGTEYVVLLGLLGREQFTTKYPDGQPATGTGMPKAAPATCPVGFPIKGNRGSNGKIYHVPGGQFYERLDPEVCFATESDAQAAGYRRSQR